MFRSVDSEAYQYNNIDKLILNYRKLEYFIGITHINKKNKLCMSNVRNLST